MKQLVTSSGDSIAPLSLRMSSSLRSLHTTQYVAGVLASPHHQTGRVLPLVQQPLTSRPWQQLDQTQLLLYSLLAVLQICCRREIEVYATRKLLNISLNFMRLILVSSQTTWLPLFQQPWYAVPFSTIHRLICINTWEGSVALTRPKYGFGNELVRC